MASSEISADDKAHLRHVQLQTPEIQFLGMIADRSGEIPWDWSKVNANAKAMVADLINKQLVREREYVTHAGQLKGALYLRLTDEGRDIVEQIKRMTVATA
jgi:hypothetical protein